MTFRTVTVLAVVLTASLGVFGEEAAETTLAGEPVDITCYMADRSGPSHAACAKSCAEKGNPIGFLTVDDEGKEKVYLVLGSGGKAAKDLMAEHMGQEVEVTGKVQEKGGMSVITVSSVSTFDDLDWLPSPAAGSGSIQNE